jgi:AbiV family abortive infection protein
MVSEQTLLEGSWLALAQAGRLLHGAAKLLAAGEPSSAVVLSMFGREELGRSRQLRDLSGDVHGGKSFSVKEVAQRCDDHVSKQEASVLSTTLRAHSFAQRNQLTDQAADAKTKRQPQHRHDARCDSLYVDLKDSGKDWNRPMDVTDQQAREHVHDAINDYANEWDQLMVMGLTPAYQPRARAPAMHEALKTMSRPVELLTAAAIRAPMHVAP